MWLRYRIEDIERNREYVRVKQAHAVGPFHISCPKEQYDFHCISIKERHKISTADDKIS